MTLATTSPPVCKQCGRPLENPQRCRECGTFQPSDPHRDHFATLALPRSYDVDETLLERRLVAFGRDLHPDRAEGCQRTLAVLGAAQVNEAYGILKDPYRRGEYLLRLLGGKSATEDKSVPAGFLEAMLEERESLEEALGRGGDPVVAIRRRFDAKLAELAQELSRGFAGLDRAPDRAAALVAMRRTLNVMAYYRGLLRDLREAAHRSDGA